MPNGEGTDRRHDAYNAEWCQEKHESINREFRMVWAKLDGMQKTLMGIVLALIANLGGIIATLILIIAG